MTGTGPSPGARRRPTGGVRQALLILAAAVALVACVNNTSPTPSALDRAEVPTASTGLPLQPTPAATAAATPSVTPTPSATASPSSTPVSPPISNLGTWQTAPDQESLRGVTFSDVAWTGARFVAVGSLDDGTGVFLDSTDAVTWHRQSTTVRNGSAGRIAAGPRGVVAVGSTGSHLASWSSADGLSWSKQRDAFPLPTLGTDTVTVTDVTVAADRWLAVGRRDPACFIDCGLDPKRSYVWRSSDGLHWTRIGDQPALKGGGMNAVSRWGDGFVAAGGAAGHAAIWTSPDGGTWSRVPDAPMFDGQTSGSARYLGVEATHVGTVGTTIAVVGNAYAQDGCPSGVAVRFCPGPRAWWSADGHAWSTAVFAKARNGQLNAMGVVGDGLLAVGWSEKCSAGVWTSADAQSWACLSGGPAPQLSDVTVGGSGTVQVILGELNLAPSEEGDPNWVSYAWYRTLP